MVNAGWWQFIAGEEACGTPSLVVVCYRTDELEKTGQMRPYGPTEAIMVAPDLRVSALVLLAPAVGWFHALHALDAADAPVLMLAGDQDTAAPPGHHADLVARQLPNRSLLDYRKVASAWHFSFLSVFPPQMREPDFVPVQDSPGFDRATFQIHLAEEIVTFLRRTALARDENQDVATSSPGYGPPDD